MVRAAVCHPLAASPPKTLWKRALGDGYSAIAVEHGVLYTAYRQGDNDVTIALDAALVILVISQVVIIVT